MKQLQQPSPVSFSSPSSLSDFLKSRIPSESLSSWGVAPGTKTLHNLWIEISNGESSIVTDSSDSPPQLEQHQQDIRIRRIVNVATLHINNSRGATLLESHQLLSDGTVRQRNRPLSEKMKAGEAIQGAAERALREELGPHVRGRVLMDTYQLNQDDDKKSVSYPGLPSRYLLHSVEAVVEEGIPEDGEFSTGEHGEGAEEEDGNALFVRKHFWKWADDDYLTQIQMIPSATATATASASSSSS